MAASYHVALAGRVPRNVAELIGRRFGEVSIHVDADRTVLEGPIADQAAVRALLNLLWDVGSDVLLLRVTPGQPPRVRRTEGFMPVRT